MKAEDFSGWIDHDGAGCPLAIGTPCRHQHAHGMVCEAVIDENDHKPIICVLEFLFFQIAIASPWFWEECKERDRIVRYQIIGTPAEEEYTHHDVRELVTDDA